MQATRRQDGAILVEFVLVLPVLLLLVFGGLQFGIAMNAKIESTHLTAEGVRYVAVNQNPGLSAGITMQSYIRNRASTARLRTATVCIAYPTNPETSTFGKVGDPVQVTMGPVTYAPFVGTLSGRTLPTPTVQSTATMRLEALPTKTGLQAGCS